jgi:formaldehyde-activating enzyme involved in methanogenesis
VCVYTQIEAKSVEHMKTVARGLENKIIELQQKLDEKVCEKFIKVTCSNQSVHYLYNSASHQLQLQNAVHSFATHNIIEQHLYLYI